MMSWGFMPSTVQPTDCAVPRHLLDRPRQLSGHGSLPHDAGDLDNLVKVHVPVVLDVFDLLAVTGRFLEGLDDEGGR